MSFFYFNNDNDGDSGHYIIARQQPIGNGCNAAACNNIYLWLVYSWCVNPFKASVLYLFLLKVACSLPLPLPTKIKDVIVYGRRYLLIHDTHIGILEFIYRYTISVNKLFY